MYPTATLEPVPLAPPAIIDDEAPYEIIDGNRVELPPMSIYASVVASELMRVLGNHAVSNRCGRAVADGLFRLPLDRERKRRPDVAFVSAARWPMDRPLPYPDNAWDVVPDLAVEVVSPTDFAEELMDKTTEYFRAGVRAVWVGYPLVQLVYVYTSLTDGRVLSGADELDGGAVLPGFCTPVAALFPALEPPRLTPAEPDG
jgi:Uma2 family endonuclease